MGEQGKTENFCISNLVIVHFLVQLWFWLRSLSKICVHACVCMCVCVCVCVLLPSSISSGESSGMTWEKADYPGLAFLISAVLKYIIPGTSVQFSSVAQSCPTLCDPMNCSTPGLPVHHKLLEFTQTQVHRVSDTIQHLIPWRPLLLPSIPPSIRVFSNESTLLTPNRTK